MIKFMECSKLGGRITVIKFEGEDHPVYYCLVHTSNKPIPSIEDALKYILRGRVYATDDAAITIYPTGFGTFPEAVISAKRKIEKHRTLQYFWKTQFIETMERLIQEYNKMYHTGDDYPLLGWAIDIQKVFNLKVN